jgi:hypothetical protein
VGNEPAGELRADLVVLGGLVGRHPTRKFLRRWIWLSAQPEQRGPLDSDQTAPGHYATAQTDPPNLQISQHPVVDLGAVYPAVLSRLGDGQPQRKCQGILHARSVRRDRSADRHERPVLVLCCTLHNPLRSPEVNPRCLGGSVD